MKLIVQNEKFKELAQNIAACFDGVEGVYNWRDLVVDVREDDEEMLVEVSQMYEYLPMHFGIMRKLAEVFGTEEYTVNNWSMSGCETCDWSSKYAHEFRYKKVL